MTLFKNPFENIVGKGENTGNQNFLLSPQCFGPFPKKFSVFMAQFFFLCKCFQCGPVQNFVVWKRGKWHSGKTRRPTVDVMVLKNLL